MKKFALCCILLTLQLTNAYAADNKTSWQRCSEMQSQTSNDAELSCYREIANQSPPSEKANTFMAGRAQSLIKEWQPNKSPLVAYKKNYALLYARRSQVNSLPYSPNPKNQVLTPSFVDNRDLKFQFSFKHDLFDLDDWGSIWMGYTQLSFWQVYDTANSRPFRENNYEPELIYSLSPELLFPEIELAPSILNIGFVHHSNGQSTPRSRSWNRFYLLSGFDLSGKDWGFGKDRKLIVLAKVWGRVREAALDDDNPDITDFMGNGEIELRYSLDRKWEASIIARKRSVQIDLSASWDAWRLLTFFDPVDLVDHNTNIHLQYFSGYGENLIDYNHKHHTWGLGLSFPFK